MKRTLLLNDTYETLCFLSERKAFKMIFKGKAEIISSWKDEINWGNDVIFHPAIIRMNYHVKRIFRNLTFSRKLIIKRDKSICQYCGQKLSAAEITIDHIIPKSKGGITSFLNCVVCCFSCNNKKGNYTLEQSRLVLLKTPVFPMINSISIESKDDFWHEDWNNFIS